VLQHGRTFAGRRRHYRQGERRQGNEREKLHGESPSSVRDHATPPTAAGQRFAQIAAELRFGARWASMLRVSTQPTDYEA